MTNQEVEVELRVLGPLEVRVGGASVVLGGAKQRAVLALLVLRAGEVVPIERLIDEVWGERPPASAGHSLEAYVSRLRRLLGGLGLSIVRRGAGYALDLGGASLDARDFSSLAEQAAQAEVEGAHESAARLAADALAMWRGPVLADVALGHAAFADAERLTELRLRTLELGFDAELALGRDTQFVAELRAVAGEHPYRERFVAQRCWRSTARAAMPRRSRSTSVRGRRLRTISACSRAPSCSNCPRRWCARSPTCVVHHPQARAPFRSE